MKDMLDNVINTHNVIIWGHQNNHRICLRSGEVVGVRANSLTVLPYPDEIGSTKVVLKKSANIAWLSD